MINPKIIKLRIELTSVFNEGGNSEDILNIESQIKELVDKDVATKALKHSKTLVFLKIKCQQSFPLS